jgi:hypothetical protein
MKSGGGVPPPERPEAAPTLATFHESEKSLPKLAISSTRRTEPVQLISAKGKRLRSALSLSKSNMPSAELSM